MGKKVGQGFWRPPLIWVGTQRATLLSGFRLPCQRLLSQTLLSPVIDEFSENKQKLTLQFKTYFFIFFLSDPCAHGVRLLGSLLSIYVYLYERFLKPSEDCQCCQCCEDLANED